MVKLSFLKDRNLFYTKDRKNDEHKGGIKMLNYLSIFLSYKQGQRNGSIPGLYALLGIGVFLLLFKPIVWVLKVTGIFSLLQWMGLINEQGYFDFVAAFLYLVGFVVLAGVLALIGTILFGLSSFLIGKAHKS
jgi:hypothetical protein